jgi:copper homeostasis protein
MQIEVCTFSIESCLNAQLAGADRVELCAGLLEGGTTPSYGLMSLAREQLTIEIHAMIRPRGGDFCYDEWEFAQMKHDIGLAKLLGIEGVVLGILLPNGQIDIDRTQQLVALAQPMCVTFHRAFDRASEPFEALEDVIKTGTRRILTSGQQPTALEGIDLLKKLVIQANHRIEIMAGAGVAAANAASLASIGVDALHLTAKSTRAGAMQYHNPNLNMASIATISDHEIVYTDAQKIRELMAALNTLTLE